MLSSELHEHLKVVHSWTQQCDQLAKALGQTNLYGIQHLLGQDICDADALRDDLAFSATVPCRGVTGDAVYGNDRSLQIWLQKQGVAHELAVSGQEMVTIAFDQYRVK